MIKPLRCYLSTVATMSMVLVLMVTILYIFYQSANEDDMKSQELKYILLWHSHNYDPFIEFGLGRRAFLDNNCLVNHCYVTQNRHLLKDVTQFDAIAFNGRTLRFMDKRDLPRRRSPKQKYVYFNMESSSNFPLGPEWNNFFNWTATYRLDSDIPYLYMRITDKKGKVVGPKVGMTWMEKMDRVPEHVEKRLRNKTKPVAWFVSNCHTLCHREKRYKELKSALSSYGLQIDVYGECGEFTCSRSQESDCDDRLENNYLFYLAYENSCNKDYVTEKVLRAFDHYTVPIVYGGADYSRFLPPNSYIDTSRTLPIEIAAIIAKSWRSMLLYKQYFKWRSHYEYFSTGGEKICDVCAALHNKTKMETSVYEDIESWWNSI